jgi:putative endonuclease
MQKGQYYEIQAARLLQQAGLELLERNYRCKLGEIDIICRDGPDIVFVEVRCRHNRRFASAAASVTISKQRKLVRTALFYLQRKGWSNDRACRFDVVAISKSTNSKTAENDEIQWLKNAFVM